MTAPNRKIHYEGSERDAIARIAVDVMDALRLSDREYALRVLRRYAPNGWSQLIGQLRHCASGPRILTLDPNDIVQLVACHNAMSPDRERTALDRDFEALITSGAARPPAEPPEPAGEPERKRA